MAANSTKNRQKVAANCQRFLELSLETDSGRYPSISRFLQQLNQLENYSTSPPEEPLSQSDASRVRLMTIHASKGLESPVVFLADCNSTSSNRNAYASLVRWPANESRPVNFQLQLNKDNTDQVTTRLQQEKLKEQAREELNLLYVALTRAREQLYISGSSSNKKDNSWYQIIASGLEKITEAATTVDGISCRRYTHLVYDALATAPAAPALPTETNRPFDARLLMPMEPALLNKSSSDFMVAPSLYTDAGRTGAHEQGMLESVDVEAARWRGIIIHRIIERLCRARGNPASQQTIDTLHQQLKAEVALHRPAYIEQLGSCMQEAVSIFNHEDLATIFNPAADTPTYNEMPLMYKQDGRTVHGVVDRVIRSQDTVLIIDYKSHQLAETESAQDVAGQFSGQLEYYANGIRKLWPDHTTRAGILFTHHKKLVWLT
jgi:ATP-dependent helicase/nuclease subunit A